MTAPGPSADTRTHIYCAECNRMTRLDGSCPNGCEHPRGHVSPLPFVQIGPNATGTGPGAQPMPSDAAQSTAVSPALLSALTDAERTLHYYAEHYVADLLAKYSIREQAMAVSDARDHLRSGAGERSG